MNINFVLVSPHYNIIRKENRFTNKYSKVYHISTKILFVSTVFNIV